MSVREFIRQRNLTIYKEFVDGKKQKAIANDRHLSPSRVKAIVAEVKAALKGGNDEQP